MEEKNVIYMKGGVGENSFLQTSLLTQKVNLVTKSLLESAVDSIFANSFHQNGVLNIADLGCAAGPNTFSVISTVGERVAKKCQELNCQKPEMVFYLNDLPGNDFNSLFGGLPKKKGDVEINLCFVMGVPGSFHSRLFPQNSLHFVYSSFSVHWLSQAPKGLINSEGYQVNKGKIYISKTSPTKVREAYLAQFQQDFTNFLKSRSEEVISKGTMVLTLHGRISQDPASSPSFDTFEQLAGAISQLVAEGLIDEEKLDSFNVPYYIPSQSEVQEIIEREASFAIQHVETTLITSLEKQGYNLWTGVEKVTRGARSFTESMISNQFGKQVLDKIYDGYARILASEWGAMDAIGAETTILVLQKM